VAAERLSRAVPDGPIDALDDGLLEGGLPVFEVVAANDDDAVEVVSRDREICDGVTELVFELRLYLVTDAAKIVSESEIEGAVRLTTRVGKESVADADALAERDIGSFDVDADKEKDWESEWDAL
jgi:hypothetical protein